MFGFGKKKHDRVTIEDQLSALAEVGIHLNPNRSVEELLESFGREEYEFEPYDTLLFALGSEVETGLDAGAYYTNQLWMLDTECIEDRGDYAMIIHRLAEMFEEELTLTNITDSIDHDNESASICFECNGRIYEQNLKFDDDWLDTNLFALIIQASEHANTTRKLGFAQPDGQSLNLSVLTPLQMKSFNKLAGAQMRPMTLKDL